MPPIPPPYPPLQYKLLYFAYGANMSSKTLVKRGLGAVPPATVAQVTHPNIALVFGHRGGYATLTEVFNVTDREGVSNSEYNKTNLKQPWWQWQQLIFPNNKNDPHDGISNSSTELVYWQPYGMLYELTQEQLELIEAKEIGYQRKNILVTTRSDSAPAAETSSNAVGTTTTTPTQVVDATVFVSAPWMTLRHPVAPTQRYRNLILQGATENNLPFRYLNWLRQLPVVVDVAILGNAEYSNTLVEAVLKSIGVGVVVLGIMSVLIHH